MKNAVFAIWCCLLILCLMVGGNAAAVESGQSSAEGAEAVVRGNSMTPLLKDGEKVKIDYGYYKTHEIRRGDIVICRFAFRHNPVIKTIRAVPGDRFGLEKVKGGTRLLVNGSVVKNSAGVPYRFSGRQERMLSLYERDYHGVVPPNAYLLLGDFPEGSLDSSRIGLVGRDAIIGKAERIFPSGTI